MDNLWLILILNSHNINSNHIMVFLVFQQLETISTYKCTLLFLTKDNVSSTRTSIHMVMKKTKNFLIMKFCFDSLGVPPLPTSRISQSLFCPACNQIVPSKVQYDNGSGTYIAGGVIAACGFWLGCCLIPCAVDDCKDSVHFCSRCNT